MLPDCTAGRLDRAKTEVLGPVRAGEELTGTFQHMYFCFKITGLGQGFNEIPVHPCTDNVLKSQAT